MNELIQFFNTPLGIVMSILPKEEAKRLSLPLKATLWAAAELGSRPLWHPVSTTQIRPVRTCVPLTSM